MKIFRNGQWFTLTEKELEAAFTEKHHQYELENAQQQFMCYSGYEDYEGDILWELEFQETYGFPPAAASDPASEHYLLETLLDRFYRECSAYRAECVTWEEVVAKVLEETSNAHQESIKKAREAADSSISGNKSDPDHAIPDIIAARFGTVEGRRALRATYGPYNKMFAGHNENGETVTLEISENGIKYTVYQSNGWIRVNHYDEDGEAAGLTFEGRHSIAG
jgi:hypothetical protein